MYFMLVEQKETLQEKIKKMGQLKIMMSICEKRDDFTSNGKT